MGRGLLLFQYRNAPQEVLWVVSFLLVFSRVHRSPSKNREAGEGERGTHGVQDGNSVKNLVVHATTRPGEERTRFHLGAILGPLIYLRSQTGSSDPSFGIKTGLGFVTDKI